MNNYYHPDQLTLSDTGLNLIKSFEGFSPKAFWDYKQWSIGYGSKAKNKNETITKEEALQRLKSETVGFQAYIKKYVCVNLTQNMFDALVSFTYNTGPGWLIRGSVLLDRLNIGDYESAADALLSWNRAGGKINSGLVSRRKQERTLFLSRT